MPRIAKLVIGLVVVASSAIIVLAYAGVAEPTLSGSQIPGTVRHGFVAIVVMVVGGALLAAYLDVRAWRRMGRRAGLTPDGRFELFANPPGGNFQLIDSPVLTGTVDGRAVRARTYTTGGGKNRSSETYTVVETDLDPPVDWHARFAPVAEGPTADLPSLGENEGMAVDGMSVWGELDEDRAREVLSGPVRESLGDLGSAVSVGDTSQHVVGSMLDELPADSGSMAQGVAKGMLNLGMQGDPDDPTEKVIHRDQGTLHDEAELRRRAEAVAALASSIERVDVAAG